MFRWLMMMFTKKLVRPRFWRGSAAVVLRGVVVVVVVVLFVVVVVEALLWL